MFVIIRGDTFELQGTSDTSYWCLSSLLFEMMPHFLQDADFLPTFVDNVYPFVNVVDVNGGVMESFGQPAGLAG